MCLDYEIHKTNRLGRADNIKIDYLKIVLKLFTSSNLASTVLKHIQSLFWACEIKLM